MSLNAFTNEPGFHKRWETKVARERGFTLYGEPQHFDHIVAQDAALVETCSKLTPMGTRPRNGKYVIGTNWARSVRKVVVDEPAKYRRYITEGGDHPYVTIDTETDYWTSVAHQVGSYQIPNPNFDNSRNESINKALTGLQSAYVNVGASLGEAHQTFDQFAGLVNRARNGLTAFRRGNPGAALQLLSGFRSRGSRLRTVAGGAANHWLEFVYGWKPLAQDIHDLQQLVHQHLSRPVVVKGKGHSHCDNSVDFWYLDWLHHSGRVRSGVSTELHGTVRNPMLLSLASAGLTNPASIAWELVPYSFVVDWFIPVGTTLQAVTATCGLDFDGGWTSSQTEEILSIQHKVNFTGYGYGCTDSGQYTEKGFSFARNCYAGFPWPAYFADTTPFSTGRCRNAAALMTQFISNR